MPLTLNPDRVHPQPGVLLVHIDEVLGGATKGGLFLPPDAADDGGRKDTASGVLLRAGASPTLAHEKKAANSTRPGRTRQNRSGTPWSEEAFPAKVGDRLTFPRDIPCLFTWGDKRYGLVNADEIILVESTGP